MEPEWGQVCGQVAVSTKGGRGAGGGLAAGIPAASGPLLLIGKESCASCLPGASRSSCPGQWSVGRKVGSCLGNKAGGRAQAGGPLRAPSLGVGVSPRNGSSQRDGVGRDLYAFFRKRTQLSVVLAGAWDLMFRAPAWGSVSVGVGWGDVGREGEAAKVVGWVLKGEQGKP